MKVDLDEEVEEMAAHVPLEFGLLIHGGSTGEGLFLFLQHPSLDIFAILFLEKQLNASIERAKMVEPGGLALSESGVPLSSEGSFVRLLGDTGPRDLRWGSLPGRRRRRRRRRRPLGLRSRRSHPFPLEDRGNSHALGRQSRLSLSTCNVGVVLVIRQSALAWRVNGVDPSASGSQSGGRLSLHRVVSVDERVGGCGWIG